MDVRELIELVNLVCATDIIEFEVERAGFRLRIVKPSAAPPAPPVRLASVESVATETRPPVVEESGLTEVVSPMVGTFFRSASPTAEPYVKIGDRVKKGQVLCIVEAMKLMNEIECETSGTLADIAVENGQPVEYGEILFKIRPDK